MRVKQPNPSPLFQSKKNAEDIALSYFPTATIIRPADVYGNEDRFLNSIAYVCNYWGFYPWKEKGLAKLQPVYCVDVADAIHSAIPDPETYGKVYELAGDEVMTWRDLFYLIGDTTIVKTNNDLQVDMLPDKAKWLLAQYYALLPFASKVTTPELYEQTGIDNLPTPGVPGLAELGVTPHDFAKTSRFVLAKFGKRGQLE